MGKLDGAVVIISGGARGIGAAQARLAVQEGAAVVIGDILDDSGASLAQELKGRRRFVHLDVTAESDWRSATEAAASFGRITGLINNAGVYAPQSLMNTDVSSFERHMRVNQLGTFLGMRAVVPIMKEGGGGSIVNMSSVAGLRGSPGSFAYSASKWAVRGMTKSAAMDLGPDGIRVNSIHPGPINTEMLSGRTEEQKQKRIQTTPLRRMGEAEEVARLAIYLLSSESAFVTGAEIAIDGGVSL